MASNFVTSTNSSTPTAAITPDALSRQANPTSTSTLYPLNTLVVDVEAALRLLDYVKLTQLGNALGEILNMTRSLLHTERTAHLPFAYSNLFDLPDDSEIDRLIMYCEDLKAVVESMSDVTAKAGVESRRTVRPLVEGIRTMLFVLDQIWLLFDEERWRHRQKRIASLEKLESLLLRLRKLIVEALLTPKHVVAKRQERIETPRMSVKKFDIFEFDTKSLRDSESPAKVLFDFYEDEDSEGQIEETLSR